MENVEERIATLEQRKVKLERRNRWLWIALAASVAVMILTVYAVQPGIQDSESITETIRAKEFVLTDSDGALRAKLVTHNGEPGVRLFDADGTITWSAP